MSARVIRRRLAAGTTALALAGLGLGIGASAASATDEVPASPYYGGTFYLTNGNDLTDLAENSEVIDYNLPLAAVTAPGDWSTPVGSVPADSTTLYIFMSPIGQESDPNAWNAYTTTPTIAGGQLLLNVSPLTLLNAGTGSPSGIAAVAGAGGDYSLGFAYTKNNGLQVVDDGLYYIHIHVTPGTLDTAKYTYERVLEEATPLPSTTTTITSAPTSVELGEAFNLTATVSESTATGTVQFKVGSDNLGAAVPVSGGVATLTGATIGTTGPKSVTAVYSGDANFAGSTSAPKTITVTGVPVPTTTTVSATSASGTALQPVVLTANIQPTSALGTVTFTGSRNGGASQTLGSALVTSASGGTVSITVSGLLDGDWEISAAFDGTDPYVDSASSTPASLSLDPSDYPTAEDDIQYVKVTIPEGTLTITTPWTSSNPLDLGEATLNDADSTWETAPKAFGATAADGIQITDRRAGAPSTTATVSSTDFEAGALSFSAAYAGLENLVANTGAGSAWVAGDVTTSDVVANAAGLSSSAQQIAHSPAGHLTGSVWLSGDFTLNGVESSVQPGTYTATLTFSAF